MSAPVELAVRRATDADRAAVLDLLADSLGWERGADFGAYFDWKHAQNPFGRSPAWVATDGDDVVGFRTFLRWELAHPDGRLRHAVRAVDTATAPSHQGRGIFRRLTTTAVAELEAEGVDFVFNTPNDRSRPGYLSMGWSTVGRLPLTARVAGLASGLRMRASRAPAGRWPVPTDAGAPAAALLADGRIDALLDAGAPVRRIRTARTAAYLRWRYGLASLGYRALAPGDDPGAGVAIFRLRRRGNAVEAGVSDVLVPEASAERERALLRLVATTTGADYVIKLGAPSLRAGFVPVPRLGPILTWRPLADRAAPPARRDLDLSLGDVELL